MEVSSTTPSLPTSSTTNSLVVNFNKNISESDLSDALLKISTSQATQEGGLTNCTFDNGTITKHVVNNVAGVGTYTISGSTLTITLAFSTYYINSFSLVGASQIGQ